MLFFYFMFAVFTVGMAFNPDLWSPYDWDKIAKGLGLPGPPASDVTYSTQPFRIVIQAHKGDYPNLTTEALQKIFSVYHNYTEYNYIERLHALIIQDYDDDSWIWSDSVDVTASNDKHFPAYYFNKSDICLPSRVPVEVTHGFSHCSTIQSGPAQGEKCINDDGNYALYSDSQSAVTGFSFSTGCDGSDKPPLHIFLAPDMLAIGTWSWGCSSSQYYYCNPEQQINRTCSMSNGGNGYITPYNYIGAFEGNDQMAKDGVYSVMGYCEKGSDGECFKPFWFPNE